MHLRPGLFLLIILWAPLSEVAAGDAAALRTPPPYDIPFDDSDEVATQAAVAEQVLLFLRTVRSQWGQTQTTVRGAIHGEIEQDEQGQLITSRTLADHRVLEGFDFRDGALVRGHFLFLQRPINRFNEFIDYYDAVKRALAESYGTPAEDRTVWENDLYQPLPDYWGVAVMIGYLRYTATWETTDGTIAIGLTGDHHSRLTIDYRSKDYLEHKHRAKLTRPIVTTLASLDSFCHSTSPQTQAFCDLRQ